MTTRKTHWEDVYATKADDSVSWFEAEPALSLELIQAVSGNRGSAIDIGGGASRLPEALLDAGFAEVTVLDLSATALRVSRDRMGARGDRVSWIAADVTQWTPDRHYDVWHDRAAFHFLTDPSDQSKYAAAIKAALAPGAIAIIGTFAPDGPDRCSGLPVMRHDGRSILEALGGGFSLLSERLHAHHTPWGSIQNFQFITLRRDAD